MCALKKDQGRRFAALVVLAGGGLAGRPAAAHFAPSPTQNNRYAKLTLLPGTVRISYTVYFGERPGAYERQRMDRNADGVLDDTERDLFGASIAAEIGPQLVVELDRARVTATWTIADVGLGTPTATGGAFSVDLLLIAPLPDPGQTAHVLYLEDRWPAPSPGENEVRVEESPGVHVVESHIRRDGLGAQLHFAWTGGTSNPEERGVLVRFAVDADLARAAAAERGADASEAAAAPRPDTTPPPVHRARSIAVAGVIAALIAAAVWLGWKRRG